MNNFMKLHRMDIQQLTEFLDDNGILENSQWLTWWDCKYCNKCGPIVYKDKYGNDHEYAFCELNNKCRFLPEFDGVPTNRDIILLWLNEDDG